MSVTYRVPRTTGDDLVDRPHRADEIDLPPEQYTYHYKVGAVHVEAEDEIAVYEEDAACDVVARDESDSGEDDDASDGADDHECDECGETFPTAMALRGHQSAHSD